LDINDEERELASSIGLYHYRGISHHQGIISQLSYSPDWKEIASCSFDGKVIKIWNIESGDARELKGHTKRITCLKFSPNSKLLASCADDATIRLWDIKSGKFKILRELDFYPKSFGFSPDGKQIVSIGELDNIALWNVSNGQFLELPINSFNPNFHPLVNFSPDGKRIFWTDKKNSIAQYEVESRYSKSLFDTLPKNYFDYYTLNIFAISAKGMLIAFSLANGFKDRDQFHYRGGRSSCSNTPEKDKLQIWDLENERIIKSIDLETCVDSLEFSPDGKKLAYSTYNTIRFLNIEHGNSMALSIRVENPSVLTFSPDGSQIAVGSCLGVIRLFDIQE